MNAKILAFAGTMASCLSFVGGYLTPSCPVLGPYLVGSGGLVMLIGNVVVLGRREAS